MTRTIGLSALALVCPLAAAGAQDATMSFFVTSAEPRQGRRPRRPRRAPTPGAPASPRPPASAARPGAPTSRPAPRTPATASAAAPGSTPRASTIAESVEALHADAHRPHQGDRARRDRRGRQRPRRRAEPPRHPDRLAARRHRRRPTPATTGPSSADGAAMLGHHDRTGLDDSPTGEIVELLARLARRLQPGGAARHRRRRPLLLLRRRLSGTARPSAVRGRRARCVAPKSVSSMRCSPFRFHTANATIRRKKQTDRAGGRSNCTRSPSSRCCSPSPPAAAPAPTRRLRRARRPWPDPQPARRPSSFTAWRDGFRGRALAQGIQPQVFDAAFQGVGVNAEVVRLDGRQAEFTKPIWEYLDGAASPARVETGRARRSQLDPTLAAIETPLRRRPPRGAGDLGHGVELRRQPRLDAGDREPRDARLRGPAPRLRRGAADRGAAHPAVRRRRPRRTWSGPGPARWATPSSCRRAISRPPSTSAATAAATSGRTTRPTRSPPPRTTSADAGWQPRPALGAWRCALPAGFNYGSRRPVEPPAGRRTGARAASPASTARRFPTTARRRSSPRPARAGRPSPSTRTSSSSRSTTTPPPTRWASATSATASPAAAPFAGAWPRGERELSRTEKIELQERLIARGYATGNDGRGDRPEHHQRHPRLPERAGPDAGRLRHRLAACRRCADGRAPAPSSPC